MLYINPTIRVVTYDRWPGARFLLVQDRIHQHYIAALPIKCVTGFPESRHISIEFDCGKSYDLYFAEKEDYDTAFAQLIAIFRYEDINHHSETVTSGSFS